MNLLVRSEELVSPLIPEGALPFVVPVGSVLATTVVFLVALAVLFGTRLSPVRLFLRRIYPAVLLFTLLAATRWSLARHVSALEGTIVVQWADQAFAVAIVLVFGLLAQRIIGFGLRILRRRIERSTPDTTKARQTSTQLIVLERISATVVAMITIAVALMVVPEIRRFGTSLLASAGIAGLILGIAAQKTIGNLIAGIQVAVTQPLRIDDAVVIDGRWGRVEEINLTYLVIRTWDNRSLIVPINRVLDQSFENWSRDADSLTGEVTLHVDYVVDLNQLRKAQTRILAKSELWDGQVNNLEVTDTTDHTVVVRSLMSARDPGALWTLRCHVRESLITYLQTAQPDAIPRERMKLHGNLHRRARQSQD